jgi:Holliday junction resolvase
LNQFIEEKKDSQSKLSFAAAQIQQLSKFVKYFGGSVE